MLRILLTALAISAASMPVSAADGSSAPADPIRELRAQLVAEIAADRPDSLNALFDSLRAAAASRGCYALRANDAFSIQLLAGKWEFFQDADSLFAYHEWRQSDPCLPEVDGSLRSLDSAFIVRQDSVQSRLDAAPGLDAEFREFLGLFLRGHRLDLWFPAPVPPGGSRDEVNRHAGDFLRAHPQSRYQAYVRSYIREEYGPSRGTMGFQWGGGAAFFSGELGRSLATGPGWNFAFQFGFRPAYGEIGFEGLHVHKLRDLSVDGELWPRRLRGDLSRLWLGIGPELFENPSWKLIGLAQVSAASFDTPPQSKSDAGLKAEEVWGFPGYGAGLILDWKALGAKDGIRSSYLGLRLRYDFILPGLGEKVPELAGGYQVLALALILTNRDTRRIW